MTAIPLKECPFCGYKPFYSVSVNGTNLIRIGCSTCGIVMNTCNLGNAENPKPSDDIVAKWNTRQEVKITIDREKLAGECYKLRCKINGGKTFVDWDIVCKDKAHPVYWVCLEDADSIIASQATLLKVAHEA